MEIQDKIDIPEFNPELNPIDSKLVEDLDKNDDSIREKIPEKIGVLPLQKIVLFPFQIAPLIITNPKSIKLINDVAISHRYICTVTQKEDKEEYLSIGGGYAETDGKELRILVSRAFGQDEINHEMTEQALANAKKILSESKDKKERLEASTLLRRSLIDSKLLKRRKRNPSV